MLAVIITNVVEVLVAVAQDKVAVVQVEIVQDRWKRKTNRRHQGRNEEEVKEVLKKKSKIRSRLLWPGLILAVRRIRG